MVRRAVGTVVYPVYSGWSGYNRVGVPSFLKINAKSLKTYVLELKTIADRSMKPKRIQETLGVKLMSITSTCPSSQRLREVAPLPQVARGVSNCPM